jgi:DNA-binding MarR family transcriptional regulator
MSEASGGDDATKPAGDPPAYRVERQIGYLLRRAHQRATAVFQATIGDPDITPTQYTSLVKLHELGELSQNHLGRLVGMDKATAQGVVRRLRQRELVAARADKNDARLRLLSLTPAGRTLVEMLMANGPKVSAETMKPLSPEDRAQLLALLGKLV